MKTEEIFYIFIGFLVPISFIFAQWQPDLRLTTASGTSETSFCNARCITAMPNGYVHITWDDGRDGNYEIYYKRSTDYGTTWLADTRLTFDINESGYPSIAGSNDTLHVVWNDNRDGPAGNWEIYYKRSVNNGITWSADTRLTFDPDTSEYPCISTTGNYIHVVWDTDIGCEIRYKRSTDAGSTWTADTILSFGSGIRRRASVISIDSVVHVVWVDLEDNFGELYYKRSTDFGVTWFADMRLTFDPNYTYTPSIYAAGANVYVAWDDARDSWDREIYFKHSSDYGLTWSNDIRLTNADGYSMFASPYASGPNVHIVWQDMRDSPGSLAIYYKYSNDYGNTWASDMRLTYATTSLRPHISALDSVLHVIWTDLRDGNYEIYYKQNPTGNVDIREDSRYQIADNRLIIKPNPFVDFTTVLGQEQERVVVYDIAGKQIAIQKGNQIGFDLPAGVYFVMPEDRSVKPVRVVKVR